MNIFLTGGTGFVGSNMLNRLLHEGHKVYAQRRVGSQPRVALHIQPTWIDAELDADFGEVLSECDLVLHLASHTPNPPYAPLDECLYWNVYAPVRLFIAAKKAGINHFLVAGSCFEYGASAIDQEYVHPASMLKPNLSYPTSKAIASNTFSALAKMENLKIKLLRIFQVYGEGEAITRLWPSLRAAAMSGQDFPMSSGSQVRDFISVDEVTAKFAEELDFSNFASGNFYVRNVGTGRPQSLLEFSQDWWRRFGATGSLQPGKKDIRPGEISRLVANVVDRYVE